MERKNNIIKCECGCKYVCGYNDDEEKHDEIHDEYLHGAYMDDLKDLKPIEKVSGYPLFMIDVTIHKDMRLRLARAERALQRETNLPTCYDGTISDDERLFLMEDKSRAIAMIFTVIDNKHCCCIWNPDGTLRVLTNESSDKLRQKICRVWIAKAYRRRGIGSLMVKAVVEFLGYKLSDLVWELPLSRDGALLVKQLYPLKFWGSGDKFALWESLTA
jgi:GNAT superfamily N-acetyltransferase